MGTRSEKIKQSGGVMKYLEKIESWLSGKIWFGDIEYDPNQIARFEVLRKLEMATKGANVSHWKNDWAEIIKIRRDRGRA